jgi:hypothetical protein
LIQSRRRRRRVGVASFHRWNVNYIKDKLGRLVPRKDQLNILVGASIWAFLFIGIVFGFIGDLFRIPLFLTIAKIMTLTFFVLVIVLLMLMAAFGVGYLVVSFTVRINDDKED